MNYGFAINHGDKIVLMELLTMDGLEAVPGVKLLLLLLLPTYDLDEDCGVV